jgi:hypothetical protein
MLQGSCSIKLQLLHSQGVPPIEGSSALLSGCTGSLDDGAATAAGSGISFIFFHFLLPTFNFLFSDTRRLILLGCAMLL